MSYQPQSHTSSAVRSDLTRCRLPRASRKSTSGAELPEAALEPAVLDRLDAICHVLQSVPELDQAIRLPAVLALIGLSKSSWYARLSRRSPAYDPRAPQPFKLGTSRNSPSVWWRSAVMAYLNACASAQAQA
ncbi:helix-turn-helix transcriptional regulator [Lysobacter claricitrinus]|uniref:helix-turn-helix transcriptional regulator n=1 Tax=Lysobacter claricitrinus TaxID=3367728 RepID=UPI0037DBED60